MACLWPRRRRLDAGKGRQRCHASASWIPGRSQATATRTGWTAGVGLDWAFAPHWSTNFAYDYYDFGANDFLLTNSVPPVTFSGNLKDRIHAVTVGVNYRFWPTTGEALRRDRAACDRARGGQLFPCRVGDVHR
ncbi:outer membrane protein [Bradyrhizobium barranii]